MPAAGFAKERGEIDGSSPEDFAIICEKTQIDARWLFGQIGGHVRDAICRFG